MQKVFIKPFRKKNIINRYINWLNDPEVNKYLQVRFNRQSFKTAQKYLDIVNNSKRHYMWGIFIKKKNYSLIGTATLIHNIKKKNAIIGFMIGNKSYWGKSESSEGFKMVCSYAFNKLFCKKVISNVEDGNISSFFMNKKHNFKYLRKYYKIIKNNKINKILIFQFQLKK